ncbi:hypothetical protein EJ02DRAFT_209075 [Clathrospora elynae]|uniref:Major facilitator superfamily (MFS) profile domain-containing protein n=1 Tax=Clathrospora elynae TaxID=706981 RepID=A0A6A5SNY6_9PLEO|nr:hypothetical protein EJ02DRAFT_209075 [Clathrospora elynae]
MVFVIGLDASALPIIVPAITDTFNSMHLIGWYGSAYLVIIGLAFQVFNNIYPISCRIWGGTGLLVFKFASFLSFEGGSLCCYLASNGASVLLGRVFCGIGVAGIFSGITSCLADKYPPHGKSRHSRIAVLFLTYALSRFVGPLIGAAIMDQLGTATAWRYVFLTNLSAIAISVFPILNWLPAYYRQSKKYQSLHGTSAAKMSILLSLFEVDIL